MPVPITMADLAPVAGDNYPVGSEPIGNNLDNYLRAHAALIRQGNAIASSSMPSGSTVNVANANGESVLITGDSTINSLGSGFVGCKRELRFSGSPTLAHSSNLQLPGNLDISASPGHVLTFRCIGSNTWLCTGGKVRGIQDVPGLTDATTTIKGIQRNATNAEAQAGALDNATITPASLASAVATMVPDASVSTKGRVQLATLAETLAGSEYNKAVVPGNLAAALATRAPVVHTHAAGDIASGTLPIARGGTGRNSWDAGTYVKVSSTGFSLQGLTPAQVRSDIGAASTGANSFTSAQTVRAGSNSDRRWVIEDSASSLNASLQLHSSGQFRMNGEGNAIHLRPNGESNAAGQMIVDTAGNVTSSGGFQFSGGPRVPRTFVQSGTPSGASDGDLWIW